MALLFRMLAAMTLLSFLMAAALPGQAQDSGNDTERQDYVMGTMDSGIVMESGPGQDTVIMITPTPEPEAESGQDDTPIEVQVQPQLDQ